MIKKLFVTQKIYILLLVLIFFLALFLRFYKLSEFPVGFHIDEASLGYNAYSLLLTGKDDNGQTLPLYIDMFGDYRPSGYHFLTILPVAFFGLTVFATRFTGALFGALTIFPIYFFAYLIFKDKRVAVLTAFILSIAPWHVGLSRASDEAIVALFLILSGFPLIVKGIMEKKIKHVIIGSVISVVSFFFYHTPRVFVPLLFLSFILALWNFWFKKTAYKFKTAVMLCFVLVSIIALSLVYVIKGGTGRFNQVNIFSHPETKLVMEEQIREDGSSGNRPLITRFFHNKPVNFGLTFISNYATYFDGSFLFIKGGLPIWYKVPGIGLIYLVELPFILVGLFYILKEKNQIYKLPVVWLFVAPIVASLTVDDVPNVNRAIVMFPMLDLIAAFGFICFLNHISKKYKYIAVTIIGVLLFYNFLYFMHQYQIHAKLHQTWYRNNGFSLLMTDLEKTYDKYDRIILTKSTGGIYPLVLFYSKFDPKVYQESGSTRNYDYTGFGKFFFSPKDCPSINKDRRFPAGKKIYVDKGDCPDNLKIPEKNQVYILREDGTKGFRIVYE